MTIRPGALRFNTDSMKLEIFRGSANYEGTASMAGIGTLAAGQWEEIQATSPEVQTGGTRALFAGGNAYPSIVDIIEYINLDSTGNAIDFGNLLEALEYTSGLSSRTRGVFGGGDIAPAYVDRIQFATVASTGNAQDFGDLTQDRHYASGVSNGTRGIFAGGERPASVVTIDYVTIAQTGNAVDFGDLGGVRYGQGPANSKTKLYFLGDLLAQTIKT